MTILCGDLAPSPANASAIALARWLAEQRPSRRCEFVSVWPGSWSGAFAGLGRLWVVNELVDSPLQAPDRILDLARYSEQTARDRSVATAIVRGSADLMHRVGLHRPADVVRGTALRRRLAASAGPVWLAGASGARLLHYLPPGRRVVGHHGSFDPSPGDAVPDGADLALLRSRVDAWVAGSELAAEALRVDEVEAPITVVPDLVHTTANVADAEVTREHLAGTGPPIGVPLVAACGEFDWWDAPDLFVQVAWETVERLGSDAHLLWVAGRSADRMLWPLRHDIAHAGLGGRVHVTPPDVRPVDALAAADVVAVTRRGLVSPAQVREIETLGVPVVRFAQPGERTGRAGATEVVPFLDDRAMAAAVVSRLLDPGMRVATRLDESGAPARVTAILDGPFGEGSR